MLWKTINQVLLGILLLICIIVTFFKSISFGHGLGDIVGYIALYLGTLVHLILTLALRNKDTAAHIALFLIFSTFIVIIALEATIYRGPEYRWNGNIFAWGILNSINKSIINMNRLPLFISALLMGNYTYAQGGMEGVGIVIVLSAIGLISALILAFSSFKRFSSKPEKANLGITISGSILFFCSALSLIVLGSSIDTGFRNTCIGAMTIALLLLVLNFRVRLKWVKVLSKTSHLRIFTYLHSPSRLSLISFLMSGIVA